MYPINEHVCRIDNIHDIIVDAAHMVACLIHYGKTADHKTIRNMIHTPAIICRFANDDHYVTKWTCNVMCRISASFCDYVGVEHCYAITSHSGYTDSDGNDIDNGLEIWKTNKLFEKLSQTSYMDTRRSLEELFKDVVNQWFSGWRMATETEVNLMLHVGKLDNQKDENGVRKHINISNSDHEYLVKARTPQKDNDLLLGLFSSAIASNGKYCDFLHGVDCMSEWRKPNKAPGYVYTDKIYAYVKKDRKEAMEELGFKFVIDN